MNEQQQRMICETILMETKGLCDLYMHGTIESATPNVRAAFDQGLKDCLNMQQTVYDKIAQMGWYPPSQAPQDQVNQLKQKFMNMQ